MSLIQEFKAFINKGNVIDLAVAVVIGKAFGDIVTAVVNGFVMPLVSLALPKDMGWVAWKLGPFPIGQILAAVLNFVVIAFVIFIVVQKLMKGHLAKKEAPAPAAPPPTPEDILLLREIRDQLKQRP